MAARRFCAHVELSSSIIIIIKLIIILVSRAVALYKFHFWRACTSHVIRTA